LGKKTLSLEVSLRQGWVPNVCPQWCWITRTMFLGREERYDYTRREGKRREEIVWYLRQL